MYPVSQEELTRLASLRASPELKVPVELNSFFLIFPENEFNSTGNFNLTETVGDARRLRLAGCGMKNEGG